MTRSLYAFLSLCSLLGAVLTYQVGGYLPIVAALATFEGFGLSSILYVYASFSRSW